MAKTAKQRFREALASAQKTSLRLLRAFPDDRAGWKPSEDANSVVQTAWPLVVGQDRLMMRALAPATGEDEPLAPPPGPPATLSAVVEAMEKAHAQVLAALDAIDDAALENETVKFFVAPKTMGAVGRLDLLYNALFDHVHHRGQLSTYLRLAGGKVPSIYGPSRDEPWR